MKSYQIGIPNRPELLQSALFAIRNLLDLECDGLIGHACVEVLPQFESSQWHKGAFSRSLSVKLAQTYRWVLQNHRNGANCGCGINGTPGL
jgi:hypothetical protein